MYKQALLHFKTHDPILFSVGKNYSIENLKPTENLYLKLFRGIVGQQLSTKAASTIFSRIEELFPKKQITPKNALNIPDEKIRAAGCSWSKIKYIKDLSQKVAKKEIDLESLRDLDNESVIFELTKVKGIGTWTAEMFLMFALGREDVFSPGDLGLKNAMIKLYNMTNPIKKNLIDVSNSWSPYKTYACLILWESLDNKPK